MESSLRTIAQDRVWSWSEANSDGFDLNDYQRSMLPPRSPLWMDSYRTSYGQPNHGPPAASHSSDTDCSSTSTSMTARHPINGQLSPISTSMDGPSGPATDDSSHGSATDTMNAPPMPQSASSSAPDSWSMIYGDAGNANMAQAIDDEDAHWEHGSDDDLTIPKVEPMDEDLRLDEITEAPPTPVPSNTSPTAIKPKRPRGRPRKHPLGPAVASNKVTKGRSKTGCLTCRKRKKKCDEAKPRCMNCEKNAVVCEGYPEKQIWKSGKDKAGEGHSHATSLPVITLQPMFQGLENAEDMIFWKHYHVHLSSILTVEGEHKNAFKELLMPIATKHQGLMHSLLALSSKHLDFETPYGLKILKDNPNTTLEALQQRSDHHHEKAMEKFYEDIVRSQSADADAPDPSARYGQMMCFLLENLAEGTPRGEHRVHLGSYQRLIQDSPPRDPAFLSFITEFFQYHIFADELIRFPDMHTPRLASEDWASFTPIHPPRLLGVADGLFKYLCQITSIRNTIRSNIAAGVDPAVDYTSLYRAAQIEQEIRAWQPCWPPGDSRDRVSLLYQQMLWTYLLRTIYPPSPGSPSATTPQMVRHSFPQPGTTNTPPVSGHSSSCSSPSIRPRTSASTPHPQPLRRHTITNYTPQPPPPSARHHHHTHSLDSHQLSTDSPPPFRQPPNLDSRIPRSVEECLTILDSFKPSDPSQKLLLIPCLVIGTLCFMPAQQDRIRVSIRTVKGYTGLRNSERVSELLEEVWRCMERGEWGRVWDWQGIAKGMGCDALCC